MKVWKLKVDAENFQRISFRNDINGKEFSKSFDGNAKKNDWSPPAVEFSKEDKEKPEGDISYLLSGFLVANKKVANMFAQSFPRFIEVLDLDTNKGLYIIHVLELCECIDLELSDIKYFPGSEKILRIKRKVFNEGVVQERSIFKSIGYPISEIYLNDIGKSIIEKWEITGVNFEELWDSDK